MERIESEFGIIGAGVAGLAAAGDLVRAGRRVCCLEASERVGGRVFTAHDRRECLPVELGAEFVHGKPHEMLRLMSDCGFVLYENTPKVLYIDGSRIVEDAGLGKTALKMLEHQAKKRRRKDESFEQILRRSGHSQDTKEWARIYIEGFNAARSDRVSTRALIAEAAAAQEIDGDRSFRLLDGYDAVPLCLLRSIPNHASVVRLNSVVDQVSWSADQVEVEFYSGLDRESRSVLCCRHLIVTASIGVLQAEQGAIGSIRLDPEPHRLLKAARTLCIGQALRITFRFQDAFWQDEGALANAGFLVSKEKEFPTWWTTYPVVSPLMTGWMAGSAAEDFGKYDPAEISSRALLSLERILRRKIPVPAAYYLHDWRTDPFVRGAYSYVPVGAREVREALSTPEAGTLLFAGEAACVNGHAGTVHGAIASGRRAARLIQQSLNRKERG